MGSRTNLGFVTFLTFLRFPLVLSFFAAALLYQERDAVGVFVFAFASLIASAATDMLDGYFARKLNVQTQFGAHADPLMDKFFYLATLPLMVYLATRNGHLRHATVLLVMTLLFLTRDQWVSFLRSLGSIYDMEGGARWIGKLRTSICFPLICAIYYYEESPVPLIDIRLLYGAEATAIAVTIYSIYSYSSHYWPCVRRSADVGEDGKDPS